MEVVEEEIGARVYVCVWGGGEGGVGLIHLYNYLGALRRSLFPPSSVVSHYSSHLFLSKVTSYHDQPLSLLQTPLSPRPTLILLFSEYWLGAGKHLLKRLLSSHRLGNQIPPVGPNYVYVSLSRNKER